MTMAGCKLDYVFVSVSLDWIGMEWVRWEFCFLYMCE